jgi:hypothetical protein
MLKEKTLLPSTLKLKHYKQGDEYFFVSPVTLYNFFIANHGLFKSLVIDSKLPMDKEYEIDFMGPVLDENNTVIRVNSIGGISLADAALESGDKLLREISSQDIE